MFAKRWSTFAVLCFCAMALLLGYCGGKNFSANLSSHSTSADSGQSQIVSAVRTVPNDRPGDDAPTPPATALAPENTADLCRRLMAQPATPARNDALLAALEELAQQHPAAAIALARSEINQRLRQQLLEAAFRGWGKTDGRAAADWILAQPEDDFDHNAAIAAMLKGVVENPDAAIQLTQQLCQKNPAQAREYGDAVIYALGRNGDFQAAADLAASATGHRDEWLAAAYGNWANYQPQTAAASALQIFDDDARRAAVDAVIPAWGQTDPQSLANFAIKNLSDGDQKTRALTDALVNWASVHPVETANWINSQNPAPYLDSGEAAIATHPDVMRQPNVALNWAENIDDANLRSRTIVAIVQTWVVSNPSAAMNFIQTSPDLLPDDRKQLLAAINTASN
jgi:hypothetical protein